MRIPLLLFASVWLLVLLLFLACPVSGFLAPAALPKRCCCALTTSSPLVVTPLCMAAPKKKRRRRKQQVANDSDDEGDLPDFELKEEIEAQESPKRRQQQQASTASSSDPLGEITPSMMASSSSSTGGGGGPTRSVTDLLRDRSIEQKLDFDEEDATVSGGEPLPDLLALARQQQQQQPPMGKKKARQAARVAAAKAAAKEQEESASSSILTKIPFILDEKGTVSPVKILESGAWLGIGLLVVWELYINSPFFERAQPMIPVVYDLFL